MKVENEVAKNIYMVKKMIKATENGSINAMIAKERYEERLMNLGVHFPVARY